MTLPPSSCVVLVPVGNRIEPETERALRELEHRGYPVWRSYGCSAIDFARSRLATQALSQGFEETLWIDSDIVFDPGYVDRLRSWTLAEIDPSQANDPARSESKPLVVTAVYSKKGLRELAVQLYSEPNETLQFGEGAPFRKAVYAPGGMLLVRREAYEQVAAKTPLPHCTTNEPFGLVPYFMPLIFQEAGNSIYLCEDFAFSRRCRDAGLTIWVDMQMRLYHMGTYPFSWEDAGKPVERYASYQFVLQPKPDPMSTAIRSESPPD